MRLPTLFRAASAPSTRSRVAVIVGAVAVAASLFVAPAAANAAGTTADDAYSLGAAEPFTTGGGMGILANDSGISVPAMISITSNPTHGRITALDEFGRFTYVPDDSFVGTDSFTYCIQVTLGCATNQSKVSLLVVGHIERIGAADRLAESAAISMSRFAPDVDTAYVASGAVFADALSAGAVAGAKGAPILLVSKDSVPGVVQAELTRLKPKHIVILGGQNTISLAAEAQLSAFGTLTRVSGADRFEVSAAVSASFFAPHVRVAYVASGEVFPDALSASAAAGTLGGPVLLVQKGAVPPAVGAELARLAPSQVVVLGGENTVSKAVFDSLSATLSTIRVAGADRYEVSAGASKGAFGPTDTHVVYVASGENFPDALAGSPAAVSRKSPVLLVSKNAIPAAIAEELTRLHPTRIVVLGGVNSISAQVETDLAAYLTK